MSRLSATMRLDTRLQARNKIYAVVGGVSVALALALRALFDPGQLEYFMPLISLGGVHATTFFVVAMIIMLEREEGMLSVVLVSPLRTSEYLGSKIATLTALALAESLVIAAVAYGAGLAVPWLVLAVLHRAALGVALGVAVGVRFASIMRFLVPGIATMIVLDLPLLWYFGIVDSSLLLLLPTAPSIVLGKAAFLSVPGIAAALRVRLRCPRRGCGGLVGIAVDRAIRRTGRECLSLPAATAIRVVWPHDLRLMWRGGALLVLMTIGMPLAALACRWAIPWLTDLVARWVELERYYGLIAASFFIGTQPANMGAVLGLLFLDERDEGTLLALQASPLSLRSFLGYRMAAAMGLNVILTIASVWIFGLVQVGFLELLLAALVASLSVPLVGFAVAVFIENKVQAINALKPLQTWGGIPVFLYFAPSPWQWIGSLVGPLYYPMRLFWTAAEGRTEWWLVVPGVVVPGLMVAWLLRRFERTIFA